MRKRQTGRKLLYGTADFVTDCVKFMDIMFVEVRGKSLESMPKKQNIKISLLLY